MNIEATLCDNCEFKHVCKFKEKYIDFTIKAGEQVIHIGGDLPVSVNFKCEYYKKVVQNQR